MERRSTNEGSEGRPISSEPEAPPFAEGASEPSASQRRYLFLAVVSLLVLAADLGTKRWAENNLRLGGVEVFHPYVELVLAKNHGGAWSLLENASEWVRRPFFLVVSVVAIGFIGTLYRKLRRDQHALKWGLSLILGGALGNLYDRVRVGAVTDFILLHATRGGHEYQWPAFNVADVAIVVGVGLMLVDTLGRKKGGHATRRPSGAPGRAV